MTHFPICPSLRQLIMPSLTIVLLLTTSATLLANPVMAPYRLDVAPAQCIALNQGNDCYAAVELSWQAPEAGDYCVYSSQQSQALQCWQARRQADFGQEIVARDNVTFYLKRAGNDAILAASQLELAWVYKKNARAHSTWRMF